MTKQEIRIRFNHFQKTNNPQQYKFYRENYKSLREPVTEVAYYETYWSSVFCACIKSNYLEIATFGRQLTDEVKEDVSFMLGTNLYRNYRQLRNKYPTASELDIDMMEKLEETK